MACFAKLFHKNHGFNPTHSSELPKLPDKSTKTETGRYISKPEGSIRFIDPDNPIPEQIHQKITLNNNHTQQNVLINFNDTNTNTILNNKENIINTNTITNNTSGTNINNNSNNIIQNNQQENQKTTTHLNSNKNNNFEDEKPQEVKMNIIKKTDTKPTNNKVISTITTTSPNSSFTTTLTNANRTNNTNTNNNNNENIKKISKEIDNNEILSKTFTNSKQQSMKSTITDTNNIKNLTIINSIPNKENLSYTKDTQEINSNKEKLLRNHHQDQQQHDKPPTTAELNTNTNVIVSCPVEDITDTLVVGGINSNIKESKKDKHKTLRKPVTSLTPPPPQSSSPPPQNSYDKTGKSIEKFQKKRIMIKSTEMVSAGHIDPSEKITNNNIILKSPINDKTISVVNLPILGAHIIGNKDYDERRHNQINQTQYGICTKITAPLYLEELKKKQQEHHHKQYQIQDEITNNQWNDEKHQHSLSSNNNYKNGYNNRECQELTEKNMTQKNKNCNSTGMTIITNISGRLVESLIDSTSTNITVADIENKNFINLSNDSDNIYCDVDIRLDDKNLKIINNDFVDDDVDKINDLAKLSNTITKIDINKETKTENTSETSNSNNNRYLSTVSILGGDGNNIAEMNRRKEGIFVPRPQVPLVENIPVHKKDEKTSKLIMKAIENNDFLNNYMDEDRKRRVIDAMEPGFYDKGKFIIRENEEGSEIYVSDDGVFDVIKNNEIINTLGSGIVFGELAILYNAKRFASIRAASKAKVWKIDRTKFRTIMKISGSKEREENLAFLRTAPLLNDLSEDILLKVVDLLVRRFFPTNTCIIRQFDVGDDFYIIRGGTVTVKKCNELGEEHKVNRLKRGNYFGEQALLNSDVRQASVYADAPGTECLKLDRVNFISYLGTIPELQEKPIDRDVVPEINPITLNTPYDFIKLKDLKRITSLGAGAFGRVDLVTYQDTKSFALKVIKKIDVVKQGQTDHIYNEKLVMSMCHRSPFIVELYNTFRDTKYVYFFMEACLGGDVWTIMYQLKCFDEKTARFISGCVVEAFDFLHSRNIIFRDLKPENLMLTTDGYCKLVDFGFAKRLSPNYKTNTFAGTPEYVAPEIILDRGHDRAADYWALGVLIYELLIGRTPFRGKNQMKIYQNILAGINVIKMPPKISKSAQNIIKNLCKQLPVERLGYQRKGIMDIKKHSWYDSFDWNRLQNQTMSSPIKRPINSIIDTQYFPTKFEIDSDIPPDEVSGWDINF